MSIQLREFTALDPKTGLFRTQPEYPEFAWLEGIVNAVTHREYALTGNYIRVTMYDDRLEILSPGRLPNLVTVNNIRETRFSRNPQIARVLTEFGLVRELNEGVKRIYADMAEQNLEAPIYTENEQSVTLVLKNNIAKRNVANVVNDSELSGTDKGVFVFVSTHKKASTKEIAETLGYNVRTVQRSVKELEKHGLLKKAGTRNNIEWIVLK